MFYQVLIILKNPFYFSALSEFSRNRSSTANSIFRFFVGKIRQIDYQLTMAQTLSAKEEIVVNKDWK